MGFTFTSRRRCGMCGYYFASGEGLGQTCLTCYARQPENFDVFAYKQPVAPKPSDREILLEQRLTRAEQGLSFLYVALDKARGPSLPPPKMVESALTLFHSQFPDLGGPPCNR